MAASKLKICEQASAESTEWEKLYQAAFKELQRTPIASLRENMRTGQLLLHTTTEDEQGILCFSLTNMLTTVALLAYIATDTTKRSSGIGSKHMKQLLVEIPKANPNLIALVAEIESTKDKTVNEETRKERKRRLRFYQRLGFKRLKTDYKAPSYNTSPDEECELIVYPFGTTFECARTSDIVKEIYLKAYVLPAEDSRIKAIPAGDTLSADCVVPDLDAQETAAAQSTASPSTVTSDKPVDSVKEEPAAITIGTTPESTKAKGAEGKIEESNKAPALSTQPSQPNK